MPDEATYEVKVIKKHRVRRELNEWVKIREPYKDEESKFASKVDREKDPQFDHRRFIRDVEVTDEVYSQIVDELDMAALVQVVNKIKKAE